MQMPAKKSAVAVGAIALALLLAPFLAGAAFGNSWVRILDFVLLYSMLALGLNIVVGYAGLLDLGYIAFYAVGAYAFALLASPHFNQMTIVARDPAQAHRFDSGNYDMHTVNENGPEAGRFLFTVFETGQAGIQRTDLRTMQTETIWHSPSAAPALDSHVSFDASR